ncbi:MAG: monovalent cation/proton antiporter, MnhG/PhaG subunit [Pseudonocardiales bacterium]|nr:monovalent cation/proton antiporter, MnhG/PhaG subunit [Pseudonocardiales bacterium]
MSAGGIADAVGAAALLGGALLSLLASIGLLRFPDVLSRMHAATKPQVLGLLLVLLGVGLRLRSSIDVGTLLVVAVFQMLTTPVAAHMVGRAAYRTGNVSGDALAFDELTDGLAGDGPGDPSARMR